MVFRSSTCGERSEFSITGTVEYADAFPRKLLDIDPEAPKTFDILTDISLFTGKASCYRKFGFSVSSTNQAWSSDLPVGRSHNIVVNEEKNYAVAVGAVPRDSTCASGLTFINMDDPAKPFSPGCAPGDGYVHDAQCLVYRGPDKKYKGRDVCYGYNEDTLTIYDVTDKQGTTGARIISKTPYQGASYTVSRRPSQLLPSAPPTVSRLTCSCLLASRMGSRPAVANPSRP